MHAEKASPKKQMFQISDKLVQTNQKSLIW